MMSIFKFFKSKYKINLWNMLTSKLLLKNTAIKKKKVPGCKGGWIV